MQNKILEIRAALQRQVRSSELALDCSLASFLAGGHLLLEGLPGTGKTLLAKSLAAVFGGEFRRIQMTSDLLPSDVVGIVRLKQGASDFEFRRGPIFSNVVLADELNRTPPKTQSALLEAMAEKTVSVDGVTHALPDPFFVVATQNPLESQGVYPLAESQLDRFMLKLVIERPSEAEERQIYGQFLERGADALDATSVNSLLSIDQIKSLRGSVARVHVDKSVLEYATTLVRKCGEHPRVTAGPSVRAGLQTLSCARALAYVRGREFVSPKEIADLAVPALAHRLYFRDEDFTTSERGAMVAETLSSIRAPI